MVNRNNDELARALEGLAAGEHVEHPEAEEGHDDHAALHPEPAPPAPAAPASRRAPVPRQSAAPAPKAPIASKPSAAPSRPAASAPGAAARPSRPPPPLPPSAAPRAARPATTPAPVTRPTRAAAPIPTAAPAGPRPSPAPKPARPSAPVPTRAAAPVAPRPQPVAEEASTLGIVAEEPAAEAYEGAPAEEESIEVQHEHQAEAMENVVEDDDSVIVPPPPMEALGHQHLEYARPRVHIPTIKSLPMLRTLVPVLLTTGVMICLFGVGLLAAREASGLFTVNEKYPWMWVLVICMGLVIAALGVLNMLLVRQQLITQQEAKDAKSMK